MKGRVLMPLFAALLLAAPVIADESVTIHVLGVAQDAGYPQAGCYEPHCMPGWEDRNARITASSIAVVDAGNESKLLFDATPNMPDQLYRLHRIAPDDEYTLDGVFLTHAHIGHYTGLMFFGHEAMGARRVPVFAMPRMRIFLETNGPWDQLVRYQNITLELLRDGSPVAFDAVKVTPFRVPHRDEYSETVGLLIEGPQRRLLYAPDTDRWSEWNPPLTDLLADVDVAILDGTFFSADELPGRDVASIGHPLIAHTMDLLEPVLEAGDLEVWFTHLNHSNPALEPGSDATRAVTERGFGIVTENQDFPI